VPLSGEARIAYDAARQDICKAHMKVYRLRHLAPTLPKGYKEERDPRFSELDRLIEIGLGDIQCNLKSTNKQ
jgi:hypothetical protein